MSHLATIKTEIKDLEAVKMLCAERGWLFKENQTEFQGYGWKKPCAHAITIPGTGLNNMTYEVGLIQTATGYTLGFDTDLVQPMEWHRINSAGKKVFGEQAVNVLGTNAGTFLQGYAVCKSTMEARRRGYMVTRKTLPSGAIQLAVSGM